MHYRYCVDDENRLEGLNPLNQVYRLNNMIKIEDVVSKFASLNPLNQVYRLNTTTHNLFDAIELPGEFRSSSPQITSTLSAVA